MDADAQQFLSGRDYSGHDWGVVDLSGVNLAGADFSHCRFSEGYLDPSEVHTKHHLDDVNYASSFSEANLRGALLSYGDFYGCDFSGADLSGAILRGADLRRTNFSGARLVGCDLSEAKLSGADFTDACLVGALLNNADLGPCRIPEKFEDSPLSGPKYVGQAIVPAAIMRRADATGVRWDGARLQGVALDSPGMVST